MNKPFVKLTTNIDKNKWKQEIAILSDKVGKLGIMYTPIAEVSEMVLKTSNNPTILEVSVDFRFDYLKYNCEITKQLGIGDIKEIAPEIDRICTMLCGEICALAHEMEQR